MTTESEHLVTPIRREERGLSLWVGLALGFAGIIVTVGGIYEWNQRKAGQHRPAAVSTPARPATTPDRLPGEDAEIVRLRRELAAAQRTAEEAQAKAWRERVDREAAGARPTRCINGTRFEQFGREWRNTGRC